MKKGLASIIEKSKSIIIKYRYENGQVEFKEIPFNNYFYIFIEDLQKVKQLLSSFDLKYKWAGDYVKIILQNNYDRYNVMNTLHQSGILTFEADLDSAKRYIVDNDLEVNAECLNYLFYDIETMDTVPFEKDLNDNVIAITPILSIAYIDNEGNKYYIKNENQKNPIEGEKEILKKHLRIISNYDIVLGWNSRKFDDSYVKQRCDYHNLDWKRIYNQINFIDYMELFKTYYKLEEYKLDYVSEKMLDMKKVEIGEKGHGTIYNLWKDSFNKPEESFEELISKYNTDDEIITLKSYNFKDVWLMYLLEQKYTLIDNLNAIANIVGAPPKYVMDSSSICDVVFLKEYNKMGIRSPTKNSIDLSGNIYKFKIEFDDDLQPIKLIYKTFNGDKNE